MNALWCILIGYGLGCLNPAYIISRIRGFDIREHGSRNAGTSNAFMMLGKAAGIFCCLFDMAKAFAAVKLAGHLFPELICAEALAAAACILGHIFPFYMRFRGGKGFACLGGALLAFSFPVFLISLGAAILLVLATDYLCLASIAASAVLPLVYALCCGDLPGTLALLLAGAAIIWKHLENLRRIREGREIHFSYLWDKEGETERMRRTGEKLPEEMEER